MLINIKENRSLGVASIVRVGAIAATYIQPFEAMVRELPLRVRKNLPHYVDHSALKCTTARPGTKRHTHSCEEIMKQQRTSPVHLRSEHHINYIVEIATSLVLLPSRPLEGEDKFRQLPAILPFARRHLPKNGGGIVVSNFPTLPNYFRGRFPLSPGQYGKIIPAPKSVPSGPAAAGQGR